MSEQMHPPSTDEIFDALSAVHRRRVLVSLLDHNPQPIEEMSAPSQDVCEMNSGLLDEFLTGSLEIHEADKESIRLHHVHLPKLVDYGFIEWDRDGNEVRKGPKFDKIRPILVLLEESFETLPDDWQ